MSWDRLTCEHCQVQYNEDNLEQISEIDEISQRAVFMKVHCANCNNTFTAAYRYDGNVRNVLDN